MTVDEHREEAAYLANFIKQDSRNRISRDHDAIALIAWQYLFQALKPLLEQDP